MASRKRSGSGSKRPKEKVVHIYELLCRGEDPKRQSAQFWEEFFLLQPNTEMLESELLKQTAEQYLNAKDNILQLFTECINMLSSGSPKRIHNALQTISVFIHVFFRKQSMVGTVGTGSDGATKDDMRKLLKYLNAIMVCDDATDSPTDICLKILLIIATGMDNVNDNRLIEFIIGQNLFEAFKKILSDSALRNLHGHDVVTLLTILVNYRKHDGSNPYVVELSLLAEELALNGYGQVISCVLTMFCKQHLLTLTELSSSSSWFSSLSSIVGNMFISDELCCRSQQIRANNSLLLALYEAIHLNRNFITTLAHTQADSTPPSPCNTLNINDGTPDLSSAAILDASHYSTNLFVSLFQYCSIVMQDHKSELSAINLKLCLLILTCIAEDQYANSMMHDTNLTFKVSLHRAHMRHRKLTSEKVAKPQPLATTLLDLLVEFIVTHLLKKFPIELYLLCIGIIHRIIVYQKRCRVRLAYHWKELWTAMISLLKFLIYQEQNLIKRCNIFELALQVINIFNLFITYGDTFLATTNSYDELYYELNREEKVFSELHAMVLRYASMQDCDHKEDAIRLLNALSNILAIIKHFQIKIKEWLASQSLSTPTEQQILEQIQKNYDLTLKLQDSLDQYERYSERPKHVLFFANLVKEVMVDTRKTVYYLVKQMNKSNALESTSLNTTSGTHVERSVLLDGAEADDMNTTM
ncbi:armadillo-like helical domain-containing protein 3 [Anopheles ziemanni]|uniref:armadillo-like helical domain-containing protein 3 n=1 Tax=Anopheles ziemanni TaxID=345580 RepID=UPI0026584947|nr:armadillo-like helical domain-containing protein 3 isoform X2 [Anopheles coustani]XP_058168732.1 armadillo-like helical domain-containing protein 3 [Anopheles ziemanni]